MAALPTGTVVFLFSDIEGSTRLLGQHPREYAEALVRHDALMSAAVVAEGGVVFETVGDAVYAAFESPTAAVNAAVRAQRGLHAEAWGELGELRVRMAVHGGEVERRGDHYFGAPLYRCARLMAIAHGGQVLLSRVIADAARAELPARVGLREMGTHRLKDLAEPEQVFQVTHPDLPADFAPLRSLDPRATNLPAPANTFVGRESERSAVRRLLRTSRFVTLTGPGGVGKTRLALQAAADAIAEFDDGVWFVPLAEIRDPGLLMSAVGQFLEIVERPREPLLQTLVRELRTKELLLVLDNFEQVTAAARSLATLIGACPKLKILVTSRVPLHLAAEKQLVVPPLQVVAGNGSKRSEPLSRSDAVTLFAERALAVRPDLAMDNANLDTIGEICTRLDGLPLAIELAAARSKVLPPRALLAGLDRRLPLLSLGLVDAPARQQSMRSAIAWSYELLGDAEREVFERLAVFSGGCTLEATERICSPDSAIDVLSAVSALVDASLIGEEVQPDGQPRFTMLETIREYALERLAEPGRLVGARAAHAAHAAHYLAFADAARPEFRGPHGAEWYRRVAKEYANVTAALDWLLSEHEGEAALRVCWDLLFFWVTRGFLSEGRRWVEGALALADGASDPTRAQALAAAGEIALMQGDTSRSRVWKEQALSLFRAIDDRRSVAALTSDLGNVALLEDDVARATVLYEESLSLRREIGLPMGIAHALVGVAAVSRYQGNYARAGAMIDEAIALAPEGDLRLNCQFNLGMLALERGDHERASRILWETLNRWNELGDVMYTAACLAGLAGVAATRGAAERATRLLGRVEGLLEPTGAVLWAEDQKTYRRTLDAARRQLDGATFASAWAEGRAMPLERAIEEAIADRP